MVDSKILFLKYCFELILKFNFRKNVEILFILKTFSELYFLQFVENCIFKIFSIIYFILIFFRKVFQIFIVNIYMEFL